MLTELMDEWDEGLSRCPGGRRTRTVGAFDLHGQGEDIGEAWEKKN